MSKKVEEILKAMERVPAIPAVVTRALELLSDPEVSANEVVNIIQYDPIITADVLRICNSAYLGLKREISSLREGVSYLGNREMLKIIVTSGALRLFDKVDKGYGLPRRELWRHSVACGLLSQILLRRTKGEDDPGVYTAALLHDIGKTILNEFAWEGHEEIMELVKNGWPSLEAEREVLGMDHAMVGAELAQRWNLPLEITLAIARHHGPCHPQEDPLTVCIVHISNIICLLMGIGVGHMGLACKAYAQAIKYLELTLEDLQISMCSLWEKLNRAEGMFNITH